MKPVLIAGISIVNLALISYATAIVIQSRKKSITRNVLTFLTLGIVFDITSTVCMVISSGKGFSFHGLIGYLSLAAMLVDTILSYRNVATNGLNSILSVKFLRWSQAAFFYWVLAYITGAIIVMTR
ncbi:MAG: hypothetical protein NTW10_03055 [Bacteroidetes bacterium]|nr:hypothetical protein [Bacteroidota bacterium]